MSCSCGQNEFVETGVGNLCTECGDPDWDDFVDDDFGEE